MTDWNPIETAPSNRELVILCDQRGRVEQGYCDVVNDASLRPGMEKGSIAAFFSNPDAYGSHTCEKPRGWRPMPVAPESA